MGLVRQGIMPATPEQYPNGKYEELMGLGKVVFEFAVAARVPAYRQQGVQFGTCHFPLGPRNTARKNVTHGESYGMAVFKNKDARRQQAALQAACGGPAPNSGFVFAKTGGHPAGVQARRGVAGADRRVQERRRRVALLRAAAELHPHAQLPRLRRGAGDGRQSDQRHLAAEDDGARGAQRVHQAGPDAGGRGAASSGDRDASGTGHRRLPAACARWRRSPAGCGRRGARLGASPRTRTWCSCRTGACWRSTPTRTATGRRD